MEPIIRIKDLSYTYPDGKQALDHISLDVFTGEKIALIGPNGAGKSTLIFHLNGILHNLSNVCIKGMTMQKEYLSIIRATVGIVFQNPDDQLFSPTVFEDVAFGPTYQGLSNETIQEKVNWALSAVKMETFAEKNPYHLSNGEKKRVAIATVLSMLPEILVLDEPTSGLDPRSRRELIDLLKELPQTMIIATHDLDLARIITQRTIVLNKGIIVAIDNTPNILNNKSLLLANGLI